MKFNLIGFNFPREPEKYRCCVVHPGSRLLQSLEDPSLLYCPQCGTTYLEKDKSAEERFLPKFGSHSSQSKIITAKKKKKYYDQHGNEINDETLLNNIAKGAKVVIYYEDKHGEEYHFVRK